MPAADSLLDILHKVRAKNNLVQDAQTPKRPPIEPLASRLFLRLRERARLVQLLNWAGLILSVLVIFWCHYELASIMPETITRVVLSTMLIASLGYLYLEYIFTPVRDWSRDRLQLALVFEHLNTPTPWAVLVRDRSDLAMEFLAFCQHSAESRPLYQPLLIHPEKSVRLKAIQSLARLPNP